MALHAQRIRSLQEMHPHLPDEISGLNISQPINQGDHIERRQAAEADAVAQILRTVALNGINDPNAREVSNSASLRAHALSTIISAEEITPYANPNEAGLLVRLNRMEHLLDRILLSTEANEAHISNLRILGRDQKLSHGEAFHPLRKTIRGSGILLARMLAPAAANLVNLNEWIADPENDPLVNANVGDAPPRLDVEGYDHNHILYLIVFYNDDLGINPADNVVERRKKIRAFLSDY